MKSSEAARSGLGSSSGAGHTHNLQLDHFAIQLHCPDFLQGSGHGGKPNVGSLPSGSQR